MVHLKEKFGGNFILIVVLSFSSPQRKSFSSLLVILFSVSWLLTIEIQKERAQKPKTPKTSFSNKSSYFKGFFN